MSLDSVTQKIAVLDRWLSSRLEETKAVEARIEQKLQTFGKLETSLQTMIDTLRRQMTEAGPIVQQTAQAREIMQKSVDQVVSDAMVRARQYANQIIHLATEKAEQQIDQKIADGLSSMTVEQAAAMTADVQQQLTEESQRCRDQAEQTLILYRQLFAAQLEAVRDEADAATQPYLSRIGEARQRIDRELDAMCESAQITLQQRLNQLARSAESSVELMEHQLVSRVKHIRPQVMTEVESTQKLIAHRVAGLVEASRKMVATVVHELDEKLDALSPHADAVRDELDLKLKTYLADLEDSAMTMVGWLEDRVSRRVDQLVEQSRGSLKQELKQLARPAIAATPVEVEPLAEPTPADEHPQCPLTLTMYVDRMRIKPEPRPAA